MYEGEDYEGGGYTSGDDKLGDIGGPGTDKEHIDMPDREFLTFRNPRAIIIGFRYNF